MSTHGKVVPWRDWGEWRFVRDCLFGGDRAAQRAGLTRVAAWRSRGRVPLAIDTTAQLVELGAHPLLPQPAALAPLAAGPSGGGGGGGGGGGAGGDGGGSGGDVVAASHVAAISTTPRSQQELQLMYSSVVVRAVNGLADAAQRGAHAAPVSTLARQIGLPGWLVDIRHQATHNRLPTLAVLQLAGRALLQVLTDGLSD